MPTKLVLMNADGSRNELSLWDSAAKWTTRSWPRTNSSTRLALQMSP